MKNFIPVILFAIVPLFYSCTGGSDQPNLPIPAQSITALKNNQTWTATLADSGVNDSLILHANGSNDVLRLKFISLRTGTYTVLDSNDYYYTTDSKGAPVNKFKIDNTAKNTISILANAQPNTLYGQFTLRFVIDSSTTNVDTGAVTFTNGKFVVRQHN